MTDTPVGAVALADVCESYFGLSIAEARREAALNRLPVPTFRARASRKAPLLVRVSDLQGVVDSAAEAARTEWRKSQ